MHANGYMQEGEYFVRALPMKIDGTPRFMMQSLSIEDSPNSGEFIADCINWKYKEYDLKDSKGNQLPTGWNDGLKNTGYASDNALRVVCR